MRIVPRNGDIAMISLTAWAFMVEVWKFGDEWDVVMGHPGRNLEDQSVVRNQNSGFLGHETSLGE